MATYNKILEEEQKVKFKGHPNIYIHIHVTYIPIIGTFGIRRIMCLNWFQNGARMFNIHFFFTNTFYNLAPIHFFTSTFHNLAPIVRFVRMYGYTCVDV